MIGLINRISIYARRSGGNVNESGDIISQAHDS
jgi:hypothetical protein